DSFLTEEIDLDAELRKAEEAAQMKPQLKPQRLTPMPENSTFEVSEVDLDLDKAKAAPEQKPESSSDEFDLSIDKGDSSLEISSSEWEAFKEARGEEVTLGEMRAGRKGTSDSGINLRDPADSGISLEQAGDSSDEIEFELSLDAESTPKPAKAA